MFLGLLDPDPGLIARGMDPDPGSFYHHAKLVRKTFDSHCFVTSFGLFIFEKDVNVPSKSNKHCKQENFLK